MLALYGHPFSSYTWKVLIALYANGTPFAFRVLDSDHPEHAAVVQRASPAGKFPVLADGDALIFESTSIIEHLDRHHPGPAPLLPDDPDQARTTRMIDRVFDNYVMNVMQVTVNEYIRNPAAPDAAVLQEVRERLERSYRWLDRWLADEPQPERISLIECAAAPPLFYADWVHPIPEQLARLLRWRAQLLAHRAVRRCVEDARPFRALFPPGAPDRD